MAHPTELPSVLQAIKVATQRHQHAHGCNAHVFADGIGLWHLVNQIKPQHVLEFGTGLGYTACLMALASPTAQVDTLEGDASHALLAQQHIDMLGLCKRVRLHTGSFATVLPALQIAPASLDMIFFDGNMPPFILVRHFYDLLREGGILICANLELNGPLGARRSKAELSTQQRWHLMPALEEGATWVACKVADNTTDST